MAGKREQSRQKILTAAEELFADRGFDAASVDSIAAAAGVNKALIYYYFKDKNDLINELFLNIMEQLDRQLKESRSEAQGPPGPDELKGLIRQQIEFLEKRSRIIAIMFMEALKGGDRDGFLFQCAEKVMNHEMDVYKESVAAKRAAMPDLGQFRVYEFFTGIIPVMAFVVFKEKWCRHFKCRNKDITDQFLGAFARTHLAAHGPGWEAEYGRF